MNTATIYRNGSLNVSAYDGEVKEYAERADKVCPSGRAGREGSLYAAPTLPGVIR